MSLKWPRCVFDAFFLILTTLSRACVWDLLLRQVVWDLGPYIQAVMSTERQCQSSKRRGCFADC